MGAVSQVATLETGKAKYTLTILIICFSFQRHKLSESQLLSGIECFRSGVPESITPIVWAIGSQIDNVIVGFYTSYLIGVSSQSN